jgi:hypothetical protein
MACGATCGITNVREREREAALAVAARLHSGMVWRRQRRAERAVSYDTLVAIGRRLEELLPVRAIVRVAADDDGADSLYLLAGLRAPALCEIADGAPCEPLSEVPLRETYLRVALSPFAPFATLQEVRIVARPMRGGDHVEIVEEPMAGVEDRRLASIVKGLQGALRREGLTLLDMAFLSGVVEGPPQRAFEAEFEERPTLWSLLFEPAPATTVRASLVLASGSA